MGKYKMPRRSRPVEEAEEEFVTILSCADLRGKCVGLKTRSFWLGIISIITILLSLAGLIFAQERIIGEKKEIVDARQDTSILSLEIARIELKQDITARLDRIQVQMNQLLDLEMKKGLGK